MLDVNMPDIDGITLVRDVAQSGRYRGRIIVASGRLDADDIQQLRAAKVDALLLKPFGVVDFLEHVRQWLAAGPRRWAMAAPAGERGRIAGGDDVDGFGPAARAGPTVQKLWAIGLPIAPSFYCH